MMEYRDYLIASKEKEDLPNLGTSFGDQNLFIERLGLSLCAGFSSMKTISI